MKTLLVFPVTLLLAGSVSLHSAFGGDTPQAEAPNPCVTELTLERLDNPPERKTNFVRSEETLKTPLNVKLIDQKFAATFDIELPMREARGFGGRQFDVARMANLLRGSEEYEQFYALQIVRGTFLLAPHTGTGAQRFENERLSQAMERMLAHIPAERPPAKADREFFASPEMDKYVSTLTGGGEPKRTFVLLGATAEESEQRAKTLLTILDQGFSRPIQLRMFKFREAQCQKAEQQKQKLAATDEELKRIGEELQKYADFTPDTLPGLRVQQFQADAELAGLKAKIAAFEKILQDKERGSPLFDAKTTAEVDLLSCEARRATIAGIIAKIKLRSELMEKQSAAVADRDDAAASVASLAKRISGIDDDIAAFAPVRLTDNRVTISKVEWVRTPEFGSGAGVSPQP